MKTLGTIQISNKSEFDEVVIDIEGVIGIPEWWQFDNPEDRIATYDKFKASADQIRSLKAKKVTVNIRSIGGCVDDALLIHDTLTGLNAEITTISFGYTASAATLIHQAGRVRKISSNSLYLVHQASSFSVGNRNEIQETLNVLEKTDKTIAALYASRTGMPEEYFSDLMGRVNGNGEWLLPDEVLQHKLADEIINTTQTSNLDTSAVQSMRLPGIPQDKIIKEIPNPQNLTEMKMKVQNGWRFIQALFNWKPGEDVDITDENLSELNNKCTDLETQNVSKSNEIANLKNENAKKDTRLQDLESKVSNLESELFRSKANPTQTKAKEDPDLLNSAKTGNALAYEQDAKNLKDFA